MPGILTSPTLTREGFRHAFTTREAGDFATLRDPVRLRANQDELARAVGFDRARLFQTKQVHGRAVATAAGDPATLLREEADAIVGEAGSEAAVAVRVADCVPVLLVDRSTRRVAAVHAGWRGVEARIVPAAVERITPGAGDVRGVVAAIGPSIGPCCFEVGQDVAERIGHVVRRVGDKAFVDLRAAVRAQLVALGVDDGAVDDVAGCTRCEAERFFSYRREGDASGRLVGVVVAG